MTKAILFWVCQRRGQTDDFTQPYFEAKSSKDGAWYDVDMFLAHRFIIDGDVNVRIRFVGFGSEEDEWVNLKTPVRERSIPLENSDCKKVKPGNLVLCFQERRDMARYYDACILEIQRRVHDIRGCRCLFLIRYDQDNSDTREGSTEEIMLETVVGFLLRSVSGAVMKD
ncbi:hypothetical protein MLD38_006165 [Melastoma candidum]|uniref:Uncharacterized protein n=1 Tax=Melastoma candidum TaxID=119954 RepID=A0ACB9RNB3_9MYRT|nr:hypothetical protein MLD38_006165 [Melastoma candidum]